MDRVNEPHARVTNVRKYEMQYMNPYVMASGNIPEGKLNPFLSETAKKTKAKREIIPVKNIPPAECLALYFLIIMPSPILAIVFKIIKR